MEDFKPSESFTLFDFSMLDSADKIKQWSGEPDTISISFYFDDDDGTASCVVSLVVYSDRTFWRASPMLVVANTIWKYIDVWARVNKFITTNNLKDRE